MVKSPTRLNKECENTEARIADVCLINCVFYLDYFFLNFLFKDQAFD